MNTNVYLKAFLAALGGLCASLLQVFLTDGVNKFSDISEISYAVAVISAIGTGIAVLSASLADSPANIRQTDQIVAAAAKLDIPVEGNPNA